MAVSAERNKEGGEYGVRAEGDGGRGVRAGAWGARVKQEDREAAAPIMAAER